MIFLITLLFAAAASGSPFTDIDTQILSGNTSSAGRELLGLLGNDDVPDELILFRLAGIYHGTGEEDRFIALLDSLQQATGEDLTGWKVSVLDQSRRGGEALQLVPDEDILLSIWLCRDSLEMPGSGIIPAPDCLAERAVRAMLCESGMMSKGQVQQTLQDSRLLPFLADEVMDELEILLEREGAWWDQMAAELSAHHGSRRLNMLLALRDLHLKSGSEEIWEYRLGLDGPVSALAARTLLEMDPQRWSESWTLTDVLVEEGHASTAESLANASNESAFAIGVSMALLRERSRHQDLLALCDTLPEGSPDSLNARAALYRARALRALQRPAVEYYSGYLDFAREFPWHPTASEAAYLAGRYFDSQRDWPAAADAYMIALRTGDFGEARAHWRGGFCHYMCGRGNVGDSIWVAGLEKYPNSSWCDEMIFWRARYANRKGDHDREEQLLELAAYSHPWEFYGLLAASRLGLDHDLPRVGSIDLAGDPVTAQAVEMMSRGYGTMASDMLFGTDLTDEGTRAAALALMGEHQRSLTLLRQLDYMLRERSEGILPDSLIRIYFPAPYRELTEATVSGVSLPPEIVTGLMRQESYFNRWARSWVGATGLIQLMPGTAGDIARWYDLPVLSHDDFYDPSKSILYGSLYLARQFSSFSGSPVLALAAYNAGPGNASKWNEAFPLEDGDPELFVEQIPLTETRGYVKHVLANSWVYGELFQ